MRNLRNILVPVIGSLLLGASAFAADVRMRLRPQLISLLDRAVLQIEFIDTKGDAVEIPPVDGLNIQYQGQQSQTQITNFKRSSKITHTYLVTPTKVGDFTIGPVTCKYKGGAKDLSAQLRVIKKSNDAEAQQISKIMFAQISTDRASPYVHEPFGLKVDVYIRDGVQIDGNFSLQGGLPESGLAGELQWKLTGPRRQVRGQTIFKVYTLRSTAATLTSGTFTFQPEIQVRVVVPRQHRRSYGLDDPFFGDFFGRQETRPIALDCNALQVDVQPVPTEQRPESYTGGVGLFDFEVEVGPTRVKAGEPITVKMRITGTGNINHIAPPVLEANHDFKLYEPRTLSTQNPNEVRFEQVLIPKSEQVTHIPAIAFSYFNTKTADFRTQTEGPFPVTVEPALQQAAQIITPTLGTIQPETQVLGRDIVYLKSAPKAWKQTGGRAKKRTAWLYVLLPVPALCLIAVAGLAGRRDALASDVGRARRQLAPKAARQHVQRAEQALRKGDGAIFYEALWAALTDYFGHRLNLAPGDVTLQTVLRHIPQEGEALGALFNTIEQRRYGLGDGTHSKSEMKSLLHQLTHTLKKCERIKL